MTGFGNLTAALISQTSIFGRTKWERGEMKYGSSSSGFQKYLLEQFNAAASDGSPNSVALSSKFPYDESSNPSALISKMPADVAFFLYGSYQQGTIGPCDLPEPTACTSVEQLKWNSWKQLSHLSSLEAMVFFLRLLEEEDPGASCFTVDVEVNSKRMETQVLKSAATMEFEIEPEEKIREIALDSKAKLSELTVCDQWVVAAVSYPRPIG